ncbi:FIST N-terminal domain-containing protein [Pseudodesulfovibrio sp. zrk46]|uniref:FIST signal transduction protein n=1 Tax=Pseudodesulfovibrio sp. zrk46 TaxID=2725288 RepID=UPI00144A1C44|nr:FIST N-terminal domain-containing protein [Pseudodesulfovibrio sp. zrk46]QJB55246.1 histidine kinase [Pseudodesulfovibrio sp. zrk46]
MKIFEDRLGSVESLRETVAQALEWEGTQSLFMLVCDGNGYTPELIDPLLNELDVPVFGGVFPMVTRGTEQLSKGNLVVALSERAVVYRVPGTDDPEADFEEMLDELVGDEDEFGTLMVFTDGLSCGNTRFVDALYNIFGLEVNYVGGGAGALSLKRVPCVISNEGLQLDTAVCAGFRMRSGVGVCHGWTTIDGPFQVTESEGNTIKSLDWRPAFEVYREVVEAHSNTQFISVPFFDIAKAYPFGIAKMGAERIVRDPVTLDGDRNIICVVDVPQGVSVDIMHGDDDSLIQAAHGALKKAQANFPDDASPNLALVMDCLSRVLFLDEKFGDELKTMVPENIECVGACSLGEIANSGKDYLELYNKTAVAALLEDA